jgi:hypothetical protein
MGSYEMTNTTLNTTALLVAAVDTLNAQIAAAKKAGVPVPGIGAEVAPGIKLRDLKNWRKEFAAKQASASVPAAASVKPAAAAPKATAAAKVAPAAEELKSGDIRAAGTVSIGRAKEAVMRISKINDVRTVVTDKGTKIAVADLEFNNRGALRVKMDLVEKYTAKTETPAPAAKAAAAPKATTSKKAAVVQEELPEEAPAATGGRVYPIRVLDIKHSTQLTGAEYDRNTSTLYVTLKDAAVWAYEGVKLSEVRAFETAALPWKHFSAHIANDKKGKMVKNHKAAPAAEKAPAAAKTVAVKPAAAKPTAKAAPAPAVEISTTALRADGFMDGRKHEVVKSINRIKDTNERIVVTESGKRVPLLSIVLSKGKFRVADLHEVPSKSKTAAAAPAAVKGTENTRKNGKAQKLDFAAAEKAPVKTPAKVVSEKPSRAQVKEAGVRVIKGSKEKLVDVIRIVNRDTGLTAVTSNKGALHYDLIVSFDGQPTYTGKITAEEFRAL